MKTLKTVTTVLSIFAVCALFVAGVSHAEIPHTINYQGKLTDSSGVPVSDGSYSVTFRIYDQEAGGAPLWFETQSVVVEKGIFSTAIGATQDLNLPFDVPYWLGIQVQSDAEMTPRQPLTSSAYAFESAHSVESTHAASSVTLDDETKLIPTGVIFPWAGTEANIPAGWLLCDGREILRSTYPDLFNVVSITYGDGDGSTTFNLPDLRGRFPLGKDDMGGTSADRVTAAEADTLGQGSGEENHTLIVNEMPSHNHSEIYVWADGGGGAPHGPGWAHWDDAGMGQHGPLAHASNGGDQPHNNMSPYITLNYIIKY